MIVVADTSPINYLVLIGSIDVLEPLYGRVLVPDAVVAELNGTKAPALVRAWIAQPPFWCEIRPDPPADPRLRFLGAGERAAITLALSLGADRLLIDDLAGRNEAERRHLRITGTLGTLADAHMAGLLDFQRALERLKSTDFRLHPDLERLIRRRMGPEKKQS